MRTTNSQRKSVRWEGLGGSREARVLRYLVSEYMIAKGFRLNQ